MPKYQIGSSERGGGVGSRAATSEIYDEAVKECRDHSRSSHVTMAWLREVDERGNLGVEVVKFRKGIVTDV